MSHSTESHRRELLILRHAKSSWKDDSLSDHERPLNKRGQKSANWMGEYFQTRQIQPDMVLCSTARRARLTLDGILESLVIEPTQIKFESDIYFSGVGAILRLIQQQSGHHGHLLVIGHEPDLSSLVSRVIEPGHPSVEVPTCTLVRVGFFLPDWAEVTGQGQILDWVKPPRTELED